ncbi:MAG TPA: DUF2294 domain-containing protein [Stenomitos sp.]
MSTPLQTKGQLERKLSQHIQSLYRQQFHQQPAKITCELGNNNLTFILEDSITQPEKTLVDQGQIQLAEEVRDNLGEAFKPELKKSLETLLQVQVLDILSDAAISSGRTGIIVILSQTPAFRGSDHRAKQNGEPLPKNVSSENLKEGSQAA